MDDVYYIYVCLDCGAQSRGPGSHSVAGDDSCSGAAGMKDHGQPRLAKVAVRVVDEGTRHHLVRARIAAKAALEEWQRQNREKLSA